MNFGYVTVNGVNSNICFPSNSPHIEKNTADLSAVPRACLKKAFCKMCVTICGIFCPDEGAVAGYGN